MLYILHELESQQRILSPEVKTFILQGSSYSGYFDENNI